MRQPNALRDHRRALPRRDVRQDYKAKCPPLRSAAHPPSLNHACGWAHELRSRDTLVTAVHAQGSVRVMARLLQRRRRRHRNARNWMICASFRDHAKCECLLEHLAKSTLDLNHQHIIPVRCIDRLSIRPQDRMNRLFQNPCFLVFLHTRVRARITDRTSSTTSASPSSSAIFTCKRRASRLENGPREHAGPCNGHDGERLPAAGSCKGMSAEGVSCRDKAIAAAILSSVSILVSDG